MRRSGIIGLVVGVWLVSLCLPAQAVLLRFKPEVNSIVKHKVTMSGRMETTGAMLPEPMRVEMTMGMTSRQKVLGQTPEGLKIHTSTSGGKMTMNTQGLPGMEGSQNSMDVPESTTVTIMDERGRVKEIVSSDLPPAASQMPLSNESLASLGSMTGFPEGDVKVDDTWSDRLNIPSAEGMPELSLSVNSRLLELLTYQGRKCAKIRTAFEGPMNLDLAQMGGAAAGASGAMEATLQGVFTQYYDYVTSVWVGGEGRMSMNMKMAVSAQGVETGPMAMKMVMNIRIQMIK